MMTRMPHIQLGDEINTRMAILPGDPKRVERIAKHFDTADDYGMSREYRSIAGTYKGRRILAMSTGMGGPSAAIAVEELAKLGVSWIVRMGQYHLEAIQALGLMDQGQALPGAEVTCAYH